MQTLEKAPAATLQQEVAGTRPELGTRELYRLKSGYNVAAITLEWSVIFSTVFLCQKFFSPVAYLVAVIVIGSRLQALGVLMHEAVHYRLFKNRKLNEIVGEFLAWPLTLTMRGYRNSHLAHHQNLNTAEDPDKNDWDKYYQFPKTKKQIFFALLENAVGLGFVYDITQTAFKHGEQFESHNDIPLKLRVAQLSFYAVVVTLAVTFSFWKLLLLFWFVPLLTATKFFDYVRAIAEHYGMESTHEYNSTRNVFGWECFFVAPYNICVHLAHHLHPGVPWYNLHKLHAVLMKDPEYGQKSLNTHGYLQVLKDCTKFK